MESKIKAIRDNLQKKIGERNKIRDSIEAESKLLLLAQKKERQLEQATAIAKEVGLKTQQQLQFHISDIVTMAFEACQIDYEFVVDFVERRNKTECDLLFKKGDNLQDPIDSSGGGAVDVAAFALRIASWTMQTPRTRNVIIFDEPLRYLSADKQPFAGQLFKELSQKLGLQFIIVTHEEAFTAAADKVFKVEIKRKKARIKNE